MKWTAYPRPDSYTISVECWRCEIKKYYEGNEVKWKAYFDGKPLRVRGGFTGVAQHRTFDDLETAKSSLIKEVKQVLEKALSKLQ